MKKATRGRTGLVLGTLLLIAAALRVAAVMTVGDVPAPHGDERYYVASGRALAAGAVYGDSMRAPGFAALLGLAFRLGGDDLAVGRLAQIPVALLGIALVFDLVRRRFGTRAAALSGLVCALHPTLVQYTHFLWSENLYATCLLLALWCLARLDATQRWTWLVAAGATLALGILTREVLLYFAPLAALWVWASGTVPTRTRAARAGLLLVCAAALVAPWTLRNQARLGRFVLVTTNRWYPIAVGNLLPPGRILGMSTEQRGFVQRFNQIPDEVDREAFARTTALRTIAGAQPMWLPRKVLRNGYYLLSTASQLGRFRAAGWLRPGNEALAARLVRAEAAFYVMQMALGIAALWLVPGGRTQQLVVALLLLHVAIYVAANATNRFRVPLLPLLSLYIGPLLCGAIVHGRALRHRSLGAGLCLAAFAAVVATPLVLRSTAEAGSEEDDPPSTGRGKPAVPPSIVLISIDTLRADHLSSYGYARPTSPQIDALAHQGVLFEHAYSPSSWTLPAHASMLSGLSPFRHGAVGGGTRIRDDAPLLAELLRGHGYATAAVVSAPFVAERFGFARGFDVFTERLTGNRDTSAYHGLVLETLRDVAQRAQPPPAAAQPSDARRRPFFLFAHYMDVHSPYVPPREHNRFAARPSPNSIFRERSYDFQELERRLAAGTTTLSAEERQLLVDLYDGEVLAIDAKIAELVAAIRDVAPRGTIVVLTSDHGEEFLEHGGVLHGRTLYDEVLHVPLIVFGDHVARGRRVTTPVSLLDIVPTLLERAGVAPAVALEGRTLEPWLAPDATPPASETAERELTLHTRAHDGSVDLRGLRTERSKLIVDRRLGRSLLFDLLRDPGEQQGREPDARLAELGRGLDALEVAPSAIAPQPDPAVVESLRALGYL